MFASGPQNAERGLSRPFVLGLILLLLFLTAQTEWSATNRTSQHKTVTALPADKLKEEVREKIITDLSISNEKLENENKAIRQQLLHLKRLYRACRGNSTESSGDGLPQRSPSTGNAGKELSDNVKTATRASLT